MRSNGSRASSPKRASARHDRAILRIALIRADAGLCGRGATVTVRPGATAGVVGDAGAASPGTAQLALAAARGASIRATAASAAGIATRAGGCVGHARDARAHGSGRPTLPAAIAIDAADLTVRASHRPAGQPLATVGNPAVGMACDSRTHGSGRPALATTIAVDAANLSLRTAHVRAGDTLRRSSVVVAADGAE